MGDSSKRKNVVAEVFPEDESSSEEEKQPPKGTQGSARYSQAQMPPNLDVEMPRKSCFFVNG